MTEILLDTDHGPELLFVASDGVLHQIDGDNWQAASLGDRDRTILRALLELCDDRMRSL